MQIAPVLAVVLAGLFLVMRTGQVDPRLWSGPALVFLAMAGFFVGWRIGLAVAIGTVLCVVSFCFLAAGNWPAASAALRLLAVCLLSGVGGAMLRPAALRIRATVALATAALLCWLGPRDRVDALKTRPPLAVMTALPLFWQEVGMARDDRPIIETLRARFQVRAIDRVADLRTGDRLLLAQPRDPGPEGLVALDSWARAGGRMLILADPQLAWPSRLPLGDRRRAPGFTALGPMLTHWGIVLESVGEGEVRHFLRDGRLVTTVKAGRLRASAPGCQAMENGLVMRCAIGRGEAIIVADADLLDDRLWLADPTRPLDGRVWAADTPDVIARWLGSPIRSDRCWVRDGSSLGRAVRWALLIGIIWAVMGTALRQRRNQDSEPFSLSDQRSIGNKVG